MDLSSLSFIAFISFFIPFYYLLRFPVAQNAILLLGSIIFYGLINVWLPAFLLVFGLLFYFAAFLNSKFKRDYFIHLTITGGLVLMLYYKYGITSLNIDGEFSWKYFILMPVGFSFYLFRLISFVLDVRDGELVFSEVTFLNFLTYIFFFPILLSGPIERSKAFLITIRERRVFNKVSFELGIAQILYGFFMKLVLSNNLSSLVRKGFLESDNVFSVDFVSSMLIYPFQMYADFGGYSHIAIGVSLLFGISIKPNFLYPFFTINIAQYWRNWHISLTSWLTDYVFTPLNFHLRSYGKFGTIFALFTTFVLIGAWHGDSLNYILFGCFHGLLFVPLVLSGKINAKSPISLGDLRLLSMIQYLGLMILNYLVVATGLVLFYFTELEDLMAKMLIGSFNYDIEVFSILDYPIMLLALLFIIFEWIGRNHTCAIHVLDQVDIFKRYKYLGLYILFLLTLVFAGKETEFIYVQF